MAKQAKSTAGMGGFLASAQHELQAQLAVCEDRRLALLKGHFDKDLANSAAALGRAITSLAGESRQQEKHAKDMVARMSDEERDSLVHEYIREVSAERRAQFRALLDELDGVSVL